MQRKAERPPKTILPLKTPGRSYLASHPVKEGSMLSHVWQADPNEAT